MKKHWHLIATVLMIATTICMACNGKKSAAKAQAIDPAKLLESIEHDEGGVTKFEYDSEDRIVKKVNYSEGAIEMTTAIAYGEGIVQIIMTNHADGSTEEERYTIKGDKVEGSDRHDNSVTMTINSDGYIVKMSKSGVTEGDGWEEVGTYQYSNGNLEKYTDEVNFSYDEQSSFVEYEYDDKKSPFYHCKSPKWFLQYMLSHYVGLNNNIVKTSSAGESSPISYEYDDGGFPVKQISICCEGEERVTAYTYRGEGGARQEGGEVLANASGGSSTSPSGSSEDGGNDPSAKTPKIVQPVRFNNRTIPITVFYHIETGGESGDVTSLDSLSFTYDDVKLSLRLKPSVLYYYVDHDAGGFSPLEVDVDYNFDGHMDIGIITSRGNTAFWKDVYIYDPQAKSYAFQKTLSEEPNLTAGKDPSKQTLYSHVNSGHAGLMYESKEYKWRGGKLVLTFTEKQDYDGDESETYTRVTRRLLGDGSWAETVKAGMSRDEAVPGN